MKFYICEHCKNVITKISDSGVPVMCCGDNMNEIIPNTVNAAQEKHVPVATINDNKVVVEVGSVMHPMDSDHYITFIVLEEENGYQIKYLNPGDSARVEFTSTNYKNVYAYCNLHGLWKIEN